MFPISLFNSDVKILVKVLANRLCWVMQHLVHPDQSGFILARSTAVNIPRLYLNKQLHSENIEDKAKTFDSVAWPYLWEVLKLWPGRKLYWLD